ncbi:RuvA protein [Candidatus Pantoea carbekii]|uniref:Holliday junction branch migration complex subunit RuvA n=1 Tax=Candidatus Pantoea carbekii TaxID=1235990 RepID=U3U336_9GAMM|nr:RuvA protein [Candidatus Pantoea carbekii]
MIGRLRGEILEKQPPLVLIEVHGVGYEVYMPMICFYKLPKINQEAIIFIEFIIRENTQLLFGFSNTKQRNLFRELIKVSGVGPKLALSILSSISTEQLMHCVECDQIELLVKLPGIGKKIANRLVMEMKDRFKRIYNKTLNTTGSDCVLSTKSPCSTLQIHHAAEEAVAALISLGYKPQEANQMIDKVITSDANCETLIREALCSVM